MLLEKITCGSKNLQYAMKRKLDFYSDQVFYRLKQEHWNVGIDVGILHVKQAFAGGGLEIFRGNVIFKPGADYRLIFCR